MNFLLVALLTYVGLCALLFFMQDRLLFIPRSSDARAVMQLQQWHLSLETQEARLEGWLIPAREPRNAPLVLYFGGNAEDISMTAPDMSSRVDANFVFMNYRGYGGSEGKPSQDAFFTDAVFVYDHMIDNAPHNGKIMVFGRSLGSSVGIYLASRRKIDAAVLVTPLDSVRNVARRRFPWLPVDLLLRNPFDAISLAPGLDIPAVFLLAARDEIVPPAHSLALAERWAGSTRVVTIKGASHNTIGWEEEFWEPVQQLLKSLQ
jgi:pimeloyl-ACP methyl ester carboxylesterase